jgi:hypothetical protein
MYGSRDFPKLFNNQKDTKISDPDEANEVVSKGINQERDW